MEGLDLGCPENTYMLCICADHEKEEQKLIQRECTERFQYKKQQSVEELLKSDIPSVPGHKEKEEKIKQ